jgi:hypothetical protein
MILNFTTEIDWKKEVKNAKNFKLEQYESDNDVDEDEDELE